ncbi:alpha-L-fucosidase [Polaribacter reichenbachii]|uniref:alpha-L-fucosidase n=1 Tax=Polaribacter reichenbachii TaxID=996801 RepID=A0A1B8TUE0_9FLAO|nr:alpha-L-fucosidase [Polaribacter reichenbachii]APZ45567.1 alpha-L-fucosidase [Polaribacter reichenbachii]AUC19429.1 alpha-L-fucosidase [Polaribacter reichenbachii]OBY63416.1 alpha-L-fucosidase [Polaribacter reichenbachii]
MNQNRIFIVVFILLLVACKQVEVNTNKQIEKYQPTLASLKKHGAAPEWFADAKLGMYFHWGPYSVPAYGSAWYPHNMYKDNNGVRKHHEKTYGSIYEFGYEDFIPMFKAEKFDPDDWAKLFKDTGAKFAGPVAQHHDGFAMWNSDVNPWNAADMGPKRDILGDIFKSLKKEGLKTIATFHHARNGQRNADKPELWKKAYNSHYVYHPDLPTATTDEKLRKLFGNFETIEEFNQYWLEQVNEVIDKYSPDILWYDSWLNLIPENKILQMAAHHFNNGLKENKEVMLAHKQEDLPKEFSVLDYEQGGRKDSWPTPWMTDVTLGKNRWMYVEGHPYKTADLVVRNMIDVWSKNGVVLLNVSPRADGVINKEQRAILKEIGDWMKVHGEAVYGTRPHNIFGFGNAKTGKGHNAGQSSTVQYTADDVRFTVAKDKKAMYIFFLGKPEIGKRIQMKSIGGYHRNIPPGKIKKIIHLGSNAATKFEHSTSTFFLTIPDTELNNLANVFKLELD